MWKHWKCLYHSLCSYNFGRLLGSVGVAVQRSQSIPTVDIEIIPIHKHDVCACVRAMEPYEFIHGVGCFDTAIRCVRAIRMPCFSPVYCNVLREHICISTMMYVFVCFCFRLRQPIQLCASRQLRNAFRMNVHFFFRLTRISVRPFSQFKFTVFSCSLSETKEVLF